MSFHRILSVDDSKMVQMVVEEALVPYHVDVVTANNGQEALEYARTNKLDLIILDITMPVMGGVEALTLLRQDPRTAPIPVIMLTAESDRKTVIQVAQLGVRDYICKPFDDETLVERVKKVLPLIARPPEKAALAPVVEPPVVAAANGISIAVVEDKINTVERIQSILSDTTWTVISNVDPSQAFAEIKANPPKCILLSLGLASDFAQTFYRQVRSDSRLQKIPVIGMSVRVKTEEQKAAREIGIRTIVMKPIDPFDLKLSLMREMGLKITQTFLKVSQNCAVLRLPAGLNDYNVHEVSRQMQEEIIELIESGATWRGLIMDLRDYTLASLTVGHLLVAFSRLCANSQLPLRSVGSPELIAQAKSVVELRSFEFHRDIESAISSL